MTDEDVMTALKEFIDVIQECAAHYGVTIAEVRSKSRLKNIVGARHMAWRRLQKRGYASHELASYFDVDLSTVRRVVT